MKVLIFMTQFYQLSGAERLAVELAQELNKRGIRADILSMYTDDLDGVDEARMELLDRGVPEVHFLGLKINPRFTSLLSAIWNLRRLLKEGQYDIVETSQLSPTTIASWATLTGRVSHVAGLHQVFDRQRENSLRHRIWRFTTRCNSRTRFYAISDYVRDAWLRYSGTAPARTQTIHNAIPDDCFDITADRSGVRKELSIPDDGQIAIFVGRLATYKGCDVLLDALAPQLENSNLYLLYVGAPDPTVAGSEEMLREMQQRIAGEGWDQQVRFLGHRDDVPRLLAAADVLTHPTQIEGFGLTLVEAMAAGTPVVSSDVEGIPEVLEGTDAVMVPPNDADRFGQAVIDVLNRPDAEALKVKQKGRSRAEAFRIGSRIDAMARLFDNLLHGRQG